MTDHPDTDTMSDPAALNASLTDRLGELAALGAALIAAEDRIAALSADKVALTRAAVRAGKATAAAQAEANRDATKARIATLRRDIGNLTEAVIAKERARFALQEDVWALTEALSEYEQLGGEAVAELSASRMQDIVRLSQPIRDTQDRLRTAEDHAAALELDLAAERDEAADARHQIAADPDAMTDLRAQMTRLVVERDRALLRAEAAQ